MNERGEGVLGQPEVTAEEIQRSMNFAVADELRKHKAAGRSIVTWDRAKGRVVIVPPDQITVLSDAQIEELTSSAHSESR